MTLTQEQMRRYATEVGYAYFFSDDIQEDPYLREYYLPHRLTGNATRATRPLQWWFNPHPAGNAPDTFGFVKKGYGNAIVVGRDQFPIIELGGNPETGGIHPNLNIRPGPRVDIVHDLNATPFPIATETYGYVFSYFVLEHIKHRSLPDVLSECYRITKHDGVNVHIVPNLRAACVALANLETWTPTAVRLIFAGDDPKNELTDYHHTGWSPQLAVDMFRAAGFSEVVVWEYPRYHLEMIIEAWKD